MSKAIGVCELFLAAIHDKPQPRGLFSRPSIGPILFVWLAFFLSLCGCGGTEMSAGRQALLTNKYDLAVVYFQHAAETDPNYIMHFGAFDQGVWSYLGRAQYLTGNRQGSRESLEKAFRSTTTIIWRGCIWA